MGDFGGTGVRFLEGGMSGGLCFYLKDCNNNHTSVTGLVASIILSTVEYKCMGVKNILVWVCVDVRACFCAIECKEGTS